MSTPLVVDGVLYFIGSMNVVRAVDATTGALLWEFDPEVRAAAGRMRAGWDHNRGIGFWKGKVYAGDVGRPADRRRRAAPARKSGAR